MALPLPSERKKDTDLTFSELWATGYGVGRAAQQILPITARVKADSTKKFARKNAATTRSTGGAGFAFEDLVAADLLSRFLLDMPIESIGVPGDRLLSQAASAGWQIDDLVCVGLSDNGLEHRLSLSCKSNIQVTNTGWPADFIQAAWQQWRNRDPYRRSTDRMALVTRGRNVEFDATWSDLKSWCTDADPAIALGRINRLAKHRRMFDSVREPGAAKDTAPTDEETVRLIARLEIYPVDFQLSASRSLAEAKQRCRAALASNKADGAEDLWAALVKAAETARLGNGLVRLKDLVRTLSVRFALKSHPSIAASLDRLRALSEDHLATIETALPNGYTISRATEADALTKTLRECAGCAVLGESGSGKSALVRSVLDRQFPEATQIWLAPDVLSDALSVGRRQALGLDHDLVFVLERMPLARKVLVLDSTERLDLADLSKLEACLTRLADDPSWRAIFISQQEGYEDRVRGLRLTNGWPAVIVPSLASADVTTALNSVPALSWIANDSDVLPLLTNPRTLGWVISASSSFPKGADTALTSAASIADHLWARWTRGPARTQLHRLVVRLAVRDAAYERSFPVSELEAGDLAAFDQRSAELPLIVNARNAIEFQHDLASDWARYQRLKEVADDIPQWSPLASQPLWIGAIRLLGQYLLNEPDQARRGWDRAFQDLTNTEDVAASDLLLDALCMDPNLDRRLAARLDLMFANDGAILRRLFHRFLHVATVPSLPSNVAMQDGLRIYFEAEMRFPILTRWGPMGRFLSAHAERVGSLGASIVARLCKTWLESLPLRLGDQLAPLRDVMARVALATAKARQVDTAARRWFGGGDHDKLIYATALSGAADVPTEVSEFALEMAGRRSISDSTQQKIDALKAADRAQADERARANPQRKKPPPPPVFLSSRVELPPWPLGPSQRLVDAFRDAVLHGNALNAMMAVAPDVASEVLLASIIEDQPERDSSRSLRADGNLGLEFDQQSYPTIFWHSPFFVYLQHDPEAALAALGQLVRFIVERWKDQAPAGIAPITVTMPSGEGRRFFGGGWHFAWSQQNSTANGQLFSAIDALERWLVLQVDAGEDMVPWCERIFDIEGSTALLGVLTNLGKFQPALLQGPLLPLVAIEALYAWDQARVKQSRLGFDAWSWLRRGKIIMNMARDWVLAPHRSKTLAEVVGDLSAADPRFAKHVQTASAAWPVPAGEKAQLEQRILKSGFDPANRVLITDPVTGETSMGLSLPPDLQVDVLAYQTKASAALEPLTLPHQCEQILAQDGDLEDESAAYLASLLPEATELPESSESLPMIAAAASTLIARGGEWSAQHPSEIAQAEQVVRAMIAHVDALPARLDNYQADEALRFAAIGALEAALNSKTPSSWDEAIATAMTARAGSALATLMQRAEANRAGLGSAWYRLNFILLLFAGLNRLSPMNGEDHLAGIWRRWRTRLCVQPIFGTDASIAIVDPVNIARRVERLLERRRERSQPDHSGGLTGKARRFVGLNAHILGLGFSWLLDYERAEETAAQPENHQLLAGLWEVEAWRMEGERDGNPLDPADDEEYDLPSGMGYSILRIAATYALTESGDAQPIWRRVLAIGPNGHHAIEQFASGWFLLLFKRIDPDRFMVLWKAMITFAFDANWTKHRRWYRGRGMLARLLGLHAPTELSQATPVRERISELRDFYRRWATEMMPRDEDDIATFCHFLTVEAGRAFMLEGMMWLNAALTKLTHLRRNGVGNNVAETVDVILTEHASELVEHRDARDAVIQIVARLVREQVAPAMGLQKRIAALR